MSDFQDSQLIANRMKSSTKKLHDLAIQVGKARQIREFSSDQRKIALSNAVAQFLLSGESVSSAEHKGRASKEYQERLAVLAKQFESAEACIAEWAAETASFEASRSLLSFSREGLKQLG